MSKKRIVFSLILGAIVMGICAFFGVTSTSRFLPLNVTVSGLLGWLVLYAFFIPGGFVSGFLIKKKGWLMGGLTACIFIAVFFVFLQVTQYYNNLPDKNYFPDAHTVPPQSVSVALMFQNFIDVMRYILGIVIAGGLGGYLGELKTKKKKSTAK
ncbi:MAG TPA: hypothetical protein VLG12_01030 [Candidatus Saccharimonadales bacterium]|nr:hypothetical protein [Candidatus Saccharimonadales bacterium]